MKAMFHFAKESKVGQWTHASRGEHVSGHVSGYVKVTADGENIKGSSFSRWILNTLRGHEVFTKGQQTGHYLQTIVNERRVQILTYIK